MFLAGKVDELAKIINFEVALACCHVAYLQATERLESSNLIINRLVEHGTNVAQVNIASIS